jgi:hypothetical protein
VFASKFCRADCCEWLAARPGIAVIANVLVERHVHVSEGSVLPEKQMNEPQDVGRQALRFASPYEKPVKSGIRLGES